VSTAAERRLVSDDEDEDSTIPPVNRPDGIGKI
jgi:hypothetical protein